MPCNAIAVARAAVPNEALFRLLDPAALAQVVTTFLAGRLPDATLTPYAFPTALYPVGTLSWFIDGPDLHLDLAITPDGRITVGTTREANRPLLDPLKSQILTLLARAGAIALQQKAAAACQAAFAVTRQVQAEDGSLILEFEI
ncbi:MAG TPA: hypothetical protein VNL35_19965 [Chloroflexota bacterium]|nr:hypothetical protein [Chloroflexota bacterium]